MRVATYAKSRSAGRSHCSGSPLPAFQRRSPAVAALTEPDNVAIAAAACELHPNAIDGAARECDRQGPAARGGRPPADRSASSASRPSSPATRSSGATTGRGGGGGGAGCKDRRNDPAERPRSRVSRVPDRADYDIATVASILDAATVCHVGLAEDDCPVVILLHARADDVLYLHGFCPSAPAPRRVEIFDDSSVSYARSVFHLSFTSGRRSCSAARSGSRTKPESSRARSVHREADPGAGPDARSPRGRSSKSRPADIGGRRSEWAKSGGPVDEPEDYELPVWAGTVPLRTVAGEALPDERRADGLTEPADRRRWRVPRSRSRSLITDAACEARFRRRSLDHAERSRAFYVDTLGLRPDDNARFEFWAGDLRHLGTGEAGLRVHRATPPSPARRRPSPCRVELGRVRLLSASAMAFRHLAADLMLHLISARDWAGGAGRRGRRAQRAWVLVRGVG